jgi:4-aminobutyrate aminotransferase
VSTAEVADLAQAEAPRLVTDVPGPEAMARIERDRKVTSPSLPRAYPFVPRRGAGSVLEDVDGNLFLDLNAGIAVTSTGHAHPAVVRAIQEQAGDLLHYSASDFFLPIYSEVAERLGAIAPMSKPVRSFLGNSGTEAVEAAIKLARHATRRQYVIAFYGAFHGRTYGSVTLTASKARYHEGFGPMLPGVLHSFYGDFAFLEDVLFRRMVSPHEVAAIVVEPVMGEGGYIVPPDGWLRYLRDLCDKHGILLVADEVQSGMGRTGRWWAIEHAGVEPDLLVSGKTLGGGLPLAAVTGKAELMDAPHPGGLGGTFGGNPVSCAAACAVLDALGRPEFRERADEVGRLIRSRLERIAADHPEIGEVRGLGPMLALEFEAKTGEETKRVTTSAREQGLLLLSCGLYGNVLRLLPPLTATDEELERGLSILERSLG